MKYYNMTAAELKEVNTMKTINEIKHDLETRSDRSAWDSGVTAYALELLETMTENRRYNKLDENVHPLEVESELLNGATNWNDFSYGGSALIYDGDIAERLCCPSELKKTRGGERNPNSRETWLDVQARALRQACRRIKSAAIF